MEQKLAREMKSKPTICIDQLQKPTYLIITHDSWFLIIRKEMLPPAGKKDSCEILQDWGQVLIKGK